MILGFKPEFVDKILKRTKIHTIRVDKHRRWKAGMVIHFATGVRTKKYDNFLIGRCQSVQTITMDFRLYPVPFLVDGKLLSLVQKMRLVENDGFDKYMDLFNFFGKPFDYFFSGVIIHWTPYRYHKKGGFTYNESSLVNEITANKDMIVAKLVQEQININKQKEIEGKGVTREQLKEIRKNSQNDHAMDAIRYGMMMPLQAPKKLGLFGRLIAWIFGK